MKIKKTEIKEKLKNAKFEALRNFNYEKGIDAYEKQKKLHGLTPKELCDLGLFYDHRKRFKEAKKSHIKKDGARALEYYQKALKKNHKLWAAWEGIGRIYWHNKDIKAIDYFEEGAKYIKNKFLAYECIGNVYLSLHKHKSAEEWYQKSLRFGAKSYSVYLNLVTLYDLWGKKKKAQKYAKICLNYLKKYPKKNRKTEEYQYLKKYLCKILNNKTE